MSYDPLSDDTKLRNAVRQVHDQLKSEQGPGISLEDVADRLFQIHGFRLDTSEVAKYLSQTLNAKRAGISPTTTAAGVASDDAGRATMDALERGTDSSHHGAASLHNLAAEAHQKAMNYHLKKAEWHTATARGETCEEPEGE